MKFPMNYSAGFISHCPLVELLFTPFQDEEPEEVYDDGDAGDIYEEDVEVGLPEDVYDDGEIGQEEEEYQEPEVDSPPPLPAPPKVWNKIDVLCVLHHQYSPLPIHRLGKNVMVLTVTV